MEQDAGNWLRWENFWRIDKSRFADPERGMIAYLSTEYTISDAILTRALVRAVAGYEKNIVWNGLPGKPFRYEETGGYVSAMFFVKDEWGRPTAEYLAYKALDALGQDSLWLDDLDFARREWMRCRIRAIEFLEYLLRRSEAWDFPESADERITEAWHEQEKEESGHEEYADMLHPTIEIVRSVARRHGWKRIPRKCAEDRLEQSNFWQAKGRKLKRLAVQLPRWNQIEKKWTKWTDEVRAFHRSLI